MSGTYLCMQCRGSGTLPLTRGMCGRCGGSGMQDRPSARTVLQSLFDLCEGDEDDILEKPIEEVRKDLEEAGLTEACDRLKADVLARLKKLREGGEAPSAQCYSDHDEDIRTKGSCDYCRGTQPQGEP